MPCRGCIRYTGGMNVYHVTPTCHVFDILEQGLLPGIGPRSHELGEEVARIYVFTDLATLDDALGNWLGNAFDEDEELSIIELSVDDARVVVPDDLYEAYILDTVAPSAIVRIVAEQEWGISVEKLPDGITPRENSPDL